VNGIVPYPVAVGVEPLLANRDRLSTAFRLIFAIPHLVLVGPAFGARWGVTQGFLGGAAYVMAVVSWFTILVRGQHLDGIRTYTMYYLRWRTRVLAYVALLTDAYPPFGDAAYPVTVTAGDPPLPRDSASVALRLVLAIPQLIVLFFVMIGWIVATIAAWLAILITGRYPASLHAFSVGAMRWSLRVEAYLLLLVDAYPPFSLE
jgi:hypothetical protein